MKALFFNPCGLARSCYGAQLFRRKIPTIASLSPAAVRAGSPGFTLTVTGGNFGANSVVRWNGQDRSTTLVNSPVVTAACRVGMGPRLLRGGNKLGVVRADC
jgi:hypothetical protein